MNRAIQRSTSALALLTVALAACQSTQQTAVRPQVPTATPQPSFTATHTLIPTSPPTTTCTPNSTPTATATSTPALAPSPAAPYTTIDDLTSGRIRGQLFFPGEAIPPLAVYAVAKDGSRFYRRPQAVPQGAVPEEHAHGSCWRSICQSRNGGQSAERRRCRGLEVRQFDR